MPRQVQNHKRTYIFVSTVIRSSRDADITGHFYKIDWSTKQILQKQPIPVGNQLIGSGSGNRGGRGIKVFKNQLFATIFEKILILDFDLNLQDEISHPLVIGHHEIAIDDTGIWCCSTPLDAFIKLDYNGNMIDDCFLGEQFPIVRDHHKYTWLDRSVDYRKIAADDDDGWIKFGEQFHPNTIVHQPGGEVHGFTNQHGYILRVRPTLEIIAEFPALYGAHNVQFVGDNIFVNNSRKRAFQIYDREQTLLLDIRIDISEHPAEQFSTPGWVRGLSFLSPTRVVIGTTPATLIEIDIERGKIIDQMILETDVTHTVHGICSSIEDSMLETNDSRDINKTQIHRIAALEQERNNQRDVLIRLSEHLSTSEKDSAERLAVIERLATHISGAERQVGEYKAAIHNYRQTVDELHERINIYENARLQLQQRITLLETELTEYTATAEQQLQSLNTEINRISTQLTTSEHSRQEQSKEIEELVRNLAVSEEESERLQCELWDIKNQRDNHAARIQHLSDVLHVSEQEAQQLREMFRNLYRQLALREANQTEQIKISQRLAEIIKINQLQLSEKEQIIAQLETRIYESEQDRAARLKVIQEQETALAAFRAHYMHPSRISRIKKWLRQWFLPKLGTFQQHPPRSLKRNYSPPKRSSSQTSVSVAIPSFNQARFLEETLLSVLKQYYAQLEIVVQDGASTDGSVDILRRYTEQLTKWCSEQDNGQAQALNMAFEGTTGTIMAYLNSDDLLMPGAINAVAHFLDTHPDVDVVYGHRILIDDAGDEIGRWVLPPHDDEVLPWVDYVPQETLFWRRQLWEKVGGQFDQSLQFAIDWDLLLRFQKAGAKFARLPRFLGAFRVHTQQKSSLLLQEVGWKEMEKLREQYIGRAVTEQEIAERTRKYLRWHVVYHKLFRLGVRI